MTGDSDFSRTSSGAQRSAGTFRAPETGQARNAEADLTNRPELGPGSTPRQISTTAPVTVIVAALGIVLAACAPARQANPGNRVSAANGAKGAFATAESSPSPDPAGPGGRAAPPKADEFLAGDASASPQAFRHWFGAHDSARREARGALWTYRLPECAIVAIFTLDAANRPLLLALEAMPRQAAAAMPQLDSCLEKAAARAKIGRAAMLPKQVLSK